MYNGNTVPSRPFCINKFKMVCPKNAPSILSSKETPYCRQGRASGGSTGHWKVQALGIYNWVLLPAWDNLLFTSNRGQLGLNPRDTCQVSEEEQRNDSSNLGSMILTFYG